MTRAAVAVIVLLALSPAAGGQSFDAASAEALAATLRALQDPGARASAIAGNPQASAIDARLQALAGSGNLQEVYALAAAIFNELASNTGGDVGKMSQALSRGTNDPRGSPQCSARRRCNVSGSSRSRSPTVALTSIRLDSLRWQGEDGAPSPRLDRPLQ